MLVSLLRFVICRNGAQPGMTWYEWGAVGAVAWVIVAVLLGIIVGSAGRGN